MKKITFMGAALLFSCSQLCGQTPTNPLSLLSEHNLIGVNQFWESTDQEEKDFGRLFQFGRNISFDYFTYYDAATRKTTEGNITPNNPAVWSDAFLIRPEGIKTYDWNKDGKTDDSWTSIVNAAQNAPKSYKGDNNGDPCPQGYHMPLLKEMNAFFPTNFSSGTYNGNNIESKLETEIIKLGNIEKEYEATYISPKVNELIGIKFIDKGNKLRTAFRWQWIDYGIEIKARLIGDNQKYPDLTSIVEDSQFWENDDVVTRMIAASGHISYSYATSSQRREDIYLWTAESSDKEGFAKTVWGFPFDKDFGEGGISTYNDVLGKGSAGAIRCVKNDKTTEEYKTPNINIGLNIYNEGDGNYLISCNQSSIGHSFKIFDMTGRLIFQGKVTNLIQHINLAQLVSGTYVLSINNQSIKFSI